MALFPKHEKILKDVGENLKLARLRRKLSTEMVAERADISRTTLWNIESGNPSTSIANILKVLAVFGMENDLLKLAEDDLLGRKLQDIGLITNKRATKK